MGRWRRLDWGFPLTPSEYIVRFSVDVVAIIILRRLLSGVWQKLWTRAIWGIAAGPLTISYGTSEVAQIWKLCLLLLGASEVARYLENRLQTGGPRPESMFVIIATFRWFLGKEARTNIDLIVADLKRDLKSMRKENRSNLFVWSVLCFQICRSIGPVLWDDFKSLVSRFSPMLVWVGKKMGLS
jgi:hypothetical protein